MSGSSLGHNPLSRAPMQPSAATLTLELQYLHRGHWSRRWSRRGSQGTAGTAWQQAKVILPAGTEMLSHREHLYGLAFWSLCLGLAGRLGARRFRRLTDKVYVEKAFVRSLSLPRSSTSSHLCNQVTVRPHSSNFHPKKFKSVAPSLVQLERSCRTHAR